MKFPQSHGVFAALATVWSMVPRADADAQSDKFAQVRGFSVEIQGCRGSRYVPSNSFSEWEAVESCGLTGELSGNSDRVGAVRYSHICLKRGSARSTVVGLQMLASAVAGERCAQAVRITAVAGFEKVEPLFTVDFASCSIDTSTAVRRFDPLVLDLNDRRFDPLVLDMNDRRFDPLVLDMDSNISLRCELRGNGGDELSNYRVLTNVQKAKHDAAMAAIQNTR